MNLVSKSSKCLIAVLGVLFLSCTKDSDEPYVPSEWRYDKYSDTEILPGDDFYRFVCGRGIGTEGADSWAPIPVLNKQTFDYMNLAYSDDDDNPVPVLKRLNELKKEIGSSPANRAAAFAAILPRLNRISRLENIEDFPAKLAEYYRNGYDFIILLPIDLDGHRFGMLVSADWTGLLLDWSEEQLAEAGIRKDEYDSRLKEARRFVLYFQDNIEEGGESVAYLDAGVAGECRQLKEYVASFAATKADIGAFARFSEALGNRNPDFIPATENDRKYFELMDRVGQELPDAAAAADAYLWCMAVSRDIDILTDPRGEVQMNFFLTVMFPNLLMNISHTFCDMYVNPETVIRSKEIFESLRRTMCERIDRSDWMTPYSKARAREKADAMECHLGILEWSDYEADMPVSDDICSALHEVCASYVTKMMRNSGDNQNLDHIIANDYMTPLIGTGAYDANFMYKRNCNATLILPSTSILTDMNPECPLQTYFIAHEICHGFDAEGVHYNARGEYGDWWSIDDKLEFGKRQNRLAEIFSQYYVGGNTFCNGDRTSDEDMADLGGFEIAWANAVRTLGEKYSGDELTEKKRRFFKSYAILMAQYLSPEDKINQVENAIHTINEYRVNGIVNNIDDWYQLFDVTPESKFYLSPERRVHLW